MKFQSTYSSISADSAPYAFIHAAKVLVLLARPFWFTALIAFRVLGPLCVNVWNAIIDSIMCKDAIIGHTS